MPCIRNENGQAVPGVKGSCPINSTWSDTQPSFLGEDQKLGVDDISRYLKDRYTTDSGNLDWTKAGLEGMMAVYGGGLARAGLTKGLPALFKQFQKLYTKPKNITTKTPAVPAVLRPGQNLNKGPLPKSAYETLAKPAGTATETIRRFAPVRAAGATALGAGGVDYFAPFTEAGLERKQVRDERSAALAAKTKEDETVIKDAAAVETAKVQAEKDRVAGLSFTEKMKEPGYWDEIDSTGLTRIQKLGQLMTYYGQTPKQRTATTSPADRWAEMSTKNAATAAALEKSRLNLKGSLSTEKTLKEFVEYQVQEEYGDRWYTMGAKEDEVASITAEIVGFMIQRSEQYPTMLQGELYLLAKEDYEKAKAEREGS
jgi:hypothetical protein